MPVNNYDPASADDTNFFDSTSILEYLITHVITHMNTVHLWFVIYSLFLNFRTILYMISYIKPGSLIDTEVSIAARRLEPVINTNISSAFTLISN